VPLSKLLSALLFYPANVVAKVMELFASTVLVTKKTRNFCAGRIAVENSFDLPLTS
jgi:hypothetical protein